MMKLLCLLLALAFSTALAAEPVREIRFLAYNVENYVRMDRAMKGGGIQSNAPKSEKSIAALISIIAAEKPDIIGVCEMGAPAEFADFLARLKQAGVDLPFTEYVEAADPERHVALASRFPISAHQSQSELSFDLTGKREYYKRGILDVTLDLSPKSQIRLLGTHLKSRRDSPEDQTLLRRAEAHLLRTYARSILQKTPACRLLLYGDLNDTINEASIREIIGNKSAPDYLQPVDLRDANGEKWTHYWKMADTYSRIDYVLASRAVLKAIDRRQSRIPSPADWNTASDHRPLLLVLRLP